MKEKKKTIWVVIGVIAVIAVAIIVSNLAEASRRPYLNKISISDYQKLLKGKDNSYVYIGKNNCTNCDTLDANLSTIATNLDVKFNYINVDNLSTSDYDKLVKSSDYFNSNWTYPALLVVKNNTIKSYNGTLSDYEAVTNFLLELKSATEKLHNITVSQYLDIFNADKKAYIYIGRTSCSHCQDFNPVLTKIVNETGIYINYINLDKVTSEEDITKLTQSNSVLSGDWGTPTMLIVQNKQVLDSNIGFATYSYIKAFLLQ